MNVFLKERKFLKGKKGFTYVELIAGMSILLIGFSFFLVMYRFSNKNKILAREKTAMSTAAQNMAEVFKVHAATLDASNPTNLTPAINAATTEGQNEGYTSAWNCRLVSGTSEAFMNGIVYIIRITVNPIDSSYSPFVLEFYWLGNNKVTNP